MMINHRIWGQVSAKATVRYTSMTLSRNLWLHLGPCRVRRPKVSETFQLTGGGGSSGSSGTGMCLNKHHPMGDIIPSSSFWSKVLRSTWLINMPMFWCPGSEKASTRFDKYLDSHPLFLEQKRFLYNLRSQWAWLSGSDVAVQTSWKVQETLVFCTCSPLRKLSTTCTTQNRGLHRTGSLMIIG